MLISTGIDGAVDRITRAPAPRFERDRVTWYLYISIDEITTKLKCTNAEISENLGIGQWAEFEM